MKKPFKKTEQQILIKCQKARSSSIESDDNDSTTSALQQLQQAGLNLTGPIWIPQRYNLTCCRGGEPEIFEQRYARNLSFNLLDYVIDESNGEETNCRTFNGKFYISPTHFLEGNLPRRNIVTCKCPNVGANGELDKNCRRLPDCRNKGIRAYSGSRKCLCQRPFFGNQCEKLCDQGQPMKDTSGNDYCSCIPFYQGEECKQIVCLHGGREESGRCICPPQFLGYHCEIDTNKTGGGNGLTGSRFQRFGEQGGEMFTRDISGTIFSLIMIVVLVVSMYLLMKHRMQVQTRYLHRRPDLLGACNFPVSPSGGQSCLSRRTELRPPHDDPRIYPFRPIGTAVIDGGPPPYVPPGQRVRRSRNEILPPLPSYEDATKMPPLRHNIPGDETSEVITPSELPSPTEDTSSHQIIPQRQTSITSSLSSASSNGTCDSDATTTSGSNHSGGGGGRACSIEFNSESRQAVVRQPPPPPAPSDGIRNLSEQQTIASNTNTELNRETNARKSL
uniref:EGF-like domain-containing protein n=1 Tax=Panagrolaimus sp. ES5 TaxID=591445 RepID=A0AC34FLG1_9BILA